MQLTPCSEQLMEQVVFLKQFEICAKLSVFWGVHGPSKGCSCVTFDFVSNTVCAPCIGRSWQKLASLNNQYSPSAIAGFP